jgi:hypothetical protein
VYDDVMDKKKKYDTTTAMGKAANQLLAKWADHKSDTITAPWRQSTEGQEFGYHHWVLTLQAAFDVNDNEAPQFRLWQLGVADYAVRSGSLHLGHRLTTCTWGCTTGPVPAGAVQRQGHLLGGL